MLVTLLDATVMDYDDKNYYKLEKNKFYQSHDNVSWVETHPQIGCDWQIRLLKKLEKLYDDAVNNGIPLRITYEYDEWGREEFEIDMFLKCICGEHINHSRTIRGSEEDMEEWEDNKWGEEEFIGYSYTCNSCGKKYVIESAPDSNLYENAVAFLEHCEKNIYDGEELL